MREHYWLQGILAVVLVTAATYLAPTLLIYLYAVVPALANHPLDDAQIQNLAFTVGILVMPAIFATAVIVATRLLRLTYRYRGVLFGLACASAVQALLFAFDSPILYDELAIYLALGGVAGYTGSAMGERSAARQEALYRTTEQIGSSNTPEQVVAAVGHHLAGSSVGSVSLWRPVESTDLSEHSDWNREPHTLIAQWGAADKKHYPHQIRVRSLPAGRSTAGDSKPKVARGQEITEFERLVRGPVAGRGATRSALVIPLGSANSRHVGTMLVTSSKRRGPSQRVIRRYMTVANQAALALENLRLINDAAQRAERTERERLAREVHDTLAQGFIAVTQNLQAALYSQDGDIHDVDSPARALVLAALESARDNAKEARRVVWDLGPSPLEDHPLPEAVYRIANTWSTHSSVQARCLVSGERYDMGAQADAALLRTVQEALTNVHKHARARNVHIQLEYAPDRISFSVADDGVGLCASSLSASLSGNAYPKPESSGYGISSMKSRISEIGGELVVEPMEGGGTIVRGMLPKTQYNASIEQKRDTDSINKIPPMTEANF